MGYGLVAIPRTMWREADVRSRQRLLCHQAGAQAKKALHAHHELTMVLPPSSLAARSDTASSGQCIQRALSVAIYYVQLLHSILGMTSAFLS